MLVQSDHLFGPSGVEGFFLVEREWGGLYKMVSNESLLFGERRERKGGWFSGKYRFGLGPPIKCFSKLKNPHSPYPQ